MQYQISLGRFIYLTDPGKNKVFLVVFFGSVHLALRISLNSNDTNEATHTCQSLSFICGILHHRSTVCGKKDFGGIDWFCVTDRVYLLFFL